jgi:hypothetical protein
VRRRGRTLKSRERAGSNQPRENRGPTKLSLNKLLNKQITKGRGSCKPAPFVYKSLPYYSAKLKLR